MEAYGIQLAAKVLVGSSEHFNGLDSFCQESRIAYGVLALGVTLELCEATLGMLSQAYMRGSYNATSLQLSS